MMNSDDWLKSIKRDIEECFGVSERVFSKCTATEKSLEFVLKQPLEKIEFTVEV